MNFNFQIKCFTSQTPVFNVFQILTLLFCWYGFKKSSTESSCLMNRYTIHGLSSPALQSQTHKASTILHFAEGKKRKKRKQTHTSFQLNVITIQAPQDNSQESSIAQSTQVSVREWELLHNCGITTC